MTMNSLTKLAESIAGSVESAESATCDELTDNGLDSSNSSLNADDEVTGLREWGTRQILPLRALSGNQEQVDPMSITALQRYIPRGKEWLELAHEGQSWWLKDLRGVANLKQDGAPTRQVVLAAGTEITIYGRTLIAESPRTLGLRNFISRLLGWNDSCIGIVDQALRTIRLATTGRVALVLRGRGDMVPIAFAIHRHTLGEKAPFLLSDPRRENMPATARCPENWVNGMEAFHMASGGALCVRAERPPPDFNEILSHFREPDSDVMLFVCMGNPARKAYSLEAAPIDIPPLESRREELGRIVREYALDAMDYLCVSKNCLSSRDLEWISQLPNLTLSEIERSLQRIAAINASRNLSNAAMRLGMRPVSLVRWINHRRGLSSYSARYIHGLVSRRTSPKSMCAHGDEPNNLPDEAAGELGSADDVPEDWGDLLDLDEEQALGRGSETSLADEAAVDVIDADGHGHLIVNAEK